MAILIWLIVAEALYVRALRVLGGRGVTVPRWQVACWHLGLGCRRSRCSRRWGRSPRTC